jgi:hypothetical protein
MRPEEQIAGAKALVIFQPFTARLKSCPVTKHEFLQPHAEFSAACKAHVDFATFVVRLKSCPFKTATYSEISKNNRRSPSTLLRASFRLRLAQNHPSDEDLSPGTPDTRQSPRGMTGCFFDANFRVRTLEGLLLVGCSGKRGPGGRRYSFVVTGFCGG